MDEPSRIQEYVQPTDVVVFAAVLLVAVSILLVLGARYLRQNRARRAAGLRALSLADATHLQAAGADVASASDEDLAAARELARQMAWERQQAGREVARYGRGMTRAYCATHDRWCKYPERGPHPPGGHDLEQAPKDWRPDRPLGN